MRENQQDLRRARKNNTKQQRRAKSAWKSWVCVLLVSGCCGAGCLHQGASQRKATQADRVHPLEKSLYGLAIRAQQQKTLAKEWRAWQSLLRSFPDTQYKNKAHDRLKTIAFLQDRAKQQAKQQSIKVVVKTSKQEAKKSASAKSAAKSAQTAPPMAQAPVDPRVVGVIYPRTGRGAALGRHIHRAIAMASESYHSIRVVFIDSQSKPDIARKAVDTLLDQHKAIAIFGPPLRKSAVAAAKRAQERGVPLISITTQEDFPKLGNYIFRNNVTLATIGRTSAQYAYKTLGIRKFGMFYPNSRYGRSQAKAFEKEVKRLGGKVVRQVAFKPGSRNLRPKLRKLFGTRYNNKHKLSVSRKQMREMKPFMRRRLYKKLRKMLKPLPPFEGMFVPEDARTSSQIAAYLTLLNIKLRNPHASSKTKELGDGYVGFKKLVMLGNNSWYHKDLFKAGKQYIEGGTFCVRFDQKSKAGRAFVTKYRREHREKPIHIDAYSYDAMHMLLTIALRGDAKTRKQFRDALGQVKQFKGPTGPIQMSAEGEAQGPFQCYAAGRGYFRAQDMITPQSMVASN